MPFSQILFLFRMITKIFYFDLINFKKSCRKEKKSDYIIINLSNALEKASVSAPLSCDLCCSVTVEAIVCIPLFLYASICLIWMLELRTIQLTVRSALHEAGKKLTVSLAEVPVLVPAVLEADVENIIGEERLQSGLIVDGIHCEKSYSWAGSGVMELRASYKARLPFPHFAVNPLEYEERMRMKVWNGYVKNNFESDTYESLVYITDTGIVYHKNPRCTYLEPSVKKVSEEEIGRLRNEDGGKYYACGWCVIAGSGEVYVTDYGTRYHSSAKCSKIKRQVYTVTLKEVKGKRACSKCGQ